MPRKVSLSNSTKPNYKPLICIMFRFCFNMWLTPLKPLNEKANCFNSAFISATTEPKQNAEVFDRCTRTSELVICTCFASQDLILIILPLQLGVSARTQRGPAGAPVTCNSHWFSYKKSTVSFKSKHRDVNNTKKHVTENFSRHKKIWHFSLALFRH